MFTVGTGVGGGLVLQRPALPRRDQRRRDRPHGDRARPRGRRAHARGKLPQPGHARVLAAGPRARPARRARGARGGGLVPRPAARAGRRGHRPRRRRRRQGGRRRRAARARHPRRAARHRDRQRDQPVRPAGDRDRRRRLDRGRPAARAGASAWPRSTRCPGARPPHDDPARPPRRAGRRARRGAWSPRTRKRRSSRRWRRRGEHEADYLPIAEHGLVGDLHTVALVGTNGTIDWYCCPAFDSPSVFGAILDKDKGGFYALRPTAEDWDVQAALLPGHERPHHALLHRGRRRRGAGLHADRRRRASTVHRHRLIRRVVVVRGQMELPDRGAAALRLRPRRARGRDAPARGAVPLARPDARARGRDRARDGPRAAARAPRRRRLRATFDSQAGESQTFVLERVAAGPHLPPVLRARDARARSRRPSATGAAGSASRATAGRWREMVHALGADAEAADLRADRRARGGADDVAARAARRRAQLGLPLHLDPRRGVLALRAAAARLHRGGRGVHGLADRPHARVEDRAERAAADHVRDRRPRRAARGRAHAPGRATAARARCGSATPRPTSASSTSTAS